MIEILLRQIPNDYSYKREYLDNHSNGIETLILGSSHSYRGVNPVYFSTSCFNAAYVSQTLDYDLEILKKYQNNLAKLKTVILPISYFSFFQQLKTATESWRVKNYIIYYGMNTADLLTDYSEILSNRLDVNLSRLSSYYIEGNSNISCSKYGWGSFQLLKAKNLEETGKTAALRHTAKNYRYLSENISILKSIIELCNRHNVKVILFTPPAFEAYRKNLNKEQLRAMLQAVNKIVADYKNCYYLNLLDNASFTADDFFNADHLNKRGAEKLSVILNSYIEDIRK